MDQVNKKILVGAGKKAGAKSPERIAQGMHLRQRRDATPPWEVPTPTSLRREAQEREKDQAKVRKLRTLTAQELRNVQELSQGQLLTLTDQVHRDDAAGLDCACVVGMKHEYQRCVAYARVGHNRWLRP
jgi:hypothetical protein